MGFQDQEGGILQDRQLFEQKADQIIDAGRFLYERGWVPATSGNFSARLDDQWAALTASGKHKGRLTRDDILVVDMQGRAKAGKPSAETLLHTVLYEAFPHIGAILHNHSVNATVLSMHCPAGSDLVFSGYEMLKALSGVVTHETSVGVPIFANTQDMVALSRDLASLLAQRPGLHGFLIQGHGLYTWGKDMVETQRHIEAFEFLFACEMERRRIFG